MFIDFYTNNITKYYPKHFVLQINTLQGMDKLFNFNCYVIIKFCIH